MTKGEKIRAAAVIILVILLCVFVTALLSNSHKNQQKLATKEFALVNAHSLLAAYYNVPNDSTGVVQSLLEKIQTDYDVIYKISISQGRHFIGNSNTSLVGERITKELFDAQSDLQKKYKEERSIASSVEWFEGDDGQKLLLLTVPILEEGGVSGILGMETKLVDIPPIGNALLIWIFGLVAIIAIIVFDKFLPKLKIPFGIIALIVFIVVSVMLVTNGVKSHTRYWEKEKAKIVKQNFEFLKKVNVPVDFEKFVNNIKAKDGDLVKISDWEPLAVSQEFLSEKSSNIQKSGLSYIIGFSIFGLICLLLIQLGLWEKFANTFYKHRTAYAYIFPAMLGVFLLVFFPFVYGFLIGFTNYNINNFSEPLLEYFTNGNNYTLSNFVSILTDFNISEYTNFYFTLFHTIIWTVLNVVLHVTIGICLALLLNDPTLKGRTIYRVLLVLPWAVPSYITALIWKGMFHKQFGAVNGLLEMIGIGAQSWFLGPIPAFLANLTTNVWLGFPFMMIISLGALQSIPKELYEAADIDGASRWQSFWNVTFPLLKPAMIPAIILGTIWTFNQFNVIYLVSGGAPDSATDILITDAYRVAFEQYRYGYAAAYCIIIFFILMAFGIYTSKVSKATEGVYG